MDFVRVIANFEVRKFCIIQALVSLLGTENSQACCHTDSDQKLIKVAEQVCVKNSKLRANI
jgi:hypothetical protein